jgi:flagellar basal-body rod modification protein FlgD
MIDATTNRPAAPPPPAPSRALPSDATTFLKMLTVQLRNQDPLNPASPTDLSVQLATFSSVEQQLQTNRLLEAMMGRAGLAEMGNWIGMEARIDGEGAFVGEPLALSVPASDQADRAFVVVRDAMGTVVDRREVPPQGGPLTWSGVGADGMTLPHGTYSLTVEGRRGDEVVNTALVSSFAPITEVRMDGTNAVLVLQGGMERTSDQITGLRAPVT